ncbi:MAG: peptide chain release factor 2 [Candidatus Portnoybacteria bacterium]|nr:peptide chain release factor 2 [Candidatus Portnoybacteria bacterium]
MIENLPKEIENLKSRVQKIADFLDLSSREVKIKEFEQQMSDPEFWQNQERAKDISQTVNDLKEEQEKWRKINKDMGDLDEMAKIAAQDESFSAELEKKFLEFSKLVANEELKNFLSDKYDSSNALLSIYSGAGGTEAQDWAEMLLRMYLRYAEKRGFVAKVLHIHEGQEAGIKNATVEVRGPYAYGHLKGEGGVHRLVRLSPFNANNLRHTSFALVEVLPEFEKPPEIKIDPADLRIDTYRSSGPGGQYVNKTESAVRITHEPTGIVVACQSERSQGSNKEQAMRMLYSKLYQRQLQAQKSQQGEIRSDQKTGQGTAEWGSQIRSYVLHPYKMVKDHRTEVESRQPNNVLDGELDEFIEAEIKSL